MSTRNELWVEKYRPKTLDQLALSEDNREFLENIIESGETPNLLLAGPPGIGKTTLAHIIVNNIDCRTLELNASNERGIDVIRQKVAQFAKSNMGTRWNVVLMDEGDALTPEAQNSMRNLMETYSDKTRFIITANYPHKIISAIKSRCMDLSLSTLSPRDRAKALARILKAEKVELDKATIVEYAKSYVDLRKMIQKAQKSVISNNGVLGPVRSTETDMSGEELWALIEGGKWDTLVSLSKEDGTDHSELLKRLFWVIPNDPPLRAAQVRSVIEEQITNSAFSPDAVVHFLGTCSKVIQKLQ